MAGEQVPCPRCGQRILTPADGRTVERPPSANALTVCLQLLTCGGFDPVNTFLGVLTVLLICAPKSRGYFRNEWGESP